MKKMSGNICSVSILLPGTACLYTMSKRAYCAACKVLGVSFSHWAESRVEAVQIE